MTLSKTLLAAALALAGVTAASDASAQYATTYGTRDQIRQIEREYARLHDGRMIPDAQLEYYLDRANNGWTMNQISRDMGGYTNRTWRPASGWVARELVCSSIDGRYRECAAPFRGRAVITQQISDASCVEGRTWGQKAGAVWVNRGCRARFGIVRGDVANRPYNGRDNRTVVCASNRGAYRECATGMRGQVALSRTLNNSNSCVEGRTWGQRSGVVWVRNGCRAQFESIGRPGWRDDDRAIGRRDWRDDDRAVGGVFTRDPGYFVTCNSVDGRRAICSWDSRYGEPRLIERLSRDACIEGRDWGYTARGELWVDAGCRARFGYR
jgi:hypothetical protein